VRKLVNRLCAGRILVIIADREAPQVGTMQYARSNNIDRLANRSMFGEWIWLAP